MDASQKLILPLGLLILSLVVVFTFPGAPDFSTYSQEKTNVRQDKKPYPIPKIGSVIESEMRLSDEIAQGFEIGINGKDINADDEPEYLILKRVPPHVTSMYSAGDHFDSHTTFVREAFVIQKTATQSDTLLYISKSGILRTHLDPLLETESAWGYAIAVLSISNKNYTKDAQIFNITLINSKLEPVSDEITIYWHPDQKQYLATNTFGAPGTFD
jgi:hypothetical protein